LSALVPHAPVADGRGDCKGAPGKVMPVVDRNRCEAKGACVAACRYRVFELRPLTEVHRATLGWRGRLKAWAHGGRQAYVVHAGDCRACGDCVEVCPEDAIRLVAAAGQVPAAK